MLRIAAAVALTLAMAPIAHAEERVARGFISEVRFAGPDVAYVRYSSEPYGIETETRIDRLIRRRPGGRPHRVVRLAYSFDSDRYESFSELADWDVSASHVLFSRHLTIHRPAGSDDYDGVRGGPIPGPFRQLMKCENRSPYDAPVAVWEGIAAYEAVCGQKQRVAVRPIDDRAARPVHVAIENVGRLDLAGDFLASGNVGGIRVFDWRDGSRVYVARSRFYDGADELSRAAAFEIQPDGKLVALLRNRGEGCPVAWFSPDGSEPHVVGHAACLPGGVRMSGDRIAWIAPDRRRLVVSDLGGIDRTIARFRMTAGRFAFDGHRLAFGVARCDGRATLLLRRQVAGPAWRDRAAVRCPLRVLGRSATAKPRKRVAALPVRCPRGCHGFLYIDRTYQYHDFSVRPGGRRLRVALDRRAVRDLKRKGSAAVTITVSPRNRAGRRMRERKLELRLRRR
jgi:hypothetical protein